MTDLVTVDNSEHSLFKSNSPKEQVRFATEMADVLTNIIKKQGMYVTIQGKEHVKVEGWQTLGTFLGITARESKVTRLDDGSYEASVDLVKFSDGTIIGGASALCSIKEKRWGNADEFARRSMAITRATGKAYRCAFSWIITLAGFQPTPAEEMPDADKKETTKPTLTEQLKKPGLKNEVYDGSTPQQERIFRTLKNRKVDEKYYGDIDRLLMGKPLSDLGVVVNNVVNKVDASAAHA